VNDPQSGIEPEVGPPESQAVLNGLSA